MNMRWDGLELPDGKRLIRDTRFGFLKVMPRPSAEEIASYYATAYQNPCTPHDPEGRAEMVCELAPQSGRILDVGCGTGDLLAAFLRRGWEAVGVEPGRQYAEQARKRGITVVEGDLTTDVAASLGTFDAILLAHVLEHLSDPGNMLEVLRPMLRPGGVLYCETPNDFNPLQEVAVAMQGLPPWWIVLPDHLNYFSISTLSDFVAGHGFEVRVRTTDFPVEIFLIWGDVYVGNPPAGREMHARRCRFEEGMRKAGQEKLLRRIYDKLGDLEVGREAIVCGVRRD